MILISKKETPEYEAVKDIVLTDPATYGGEILPYMPRLSEIPERLSW